MLSIDSSLVTDVSQGSLVNTLHLSKELKIHFLKRKKQKQNQTKQKLAWQLLEVLSCNLLKQDCAFKVKIHFLESFECWHFV